MKTTWADILKAIKSLKTRLVVAILSTVFFGMMLMWYEDLTDSLVPSLIDFVQNVLSSPEKSGKNAAAPREIVYGWVGVNAGDFKRVNIGNQRINFRWCPPGTFMMGSPKDEKGRLTISEDQVQVTLTRGFWMMETEVTQGIWEGVTGKRLEWEPYSGLGRQYPAYDVCWPQAMEFAAKLDQKLREKYPDLPNDLKIQLPTEAQWEYSCRAGTTTRFHFGDDEKLLGDYAWFDDNSGEKAHPVARKKPNAWGLYDMQGNIWEWTADYFDIKVSGGNDRPGEWVVSRASRQLLAHPSRVLPVGST